MARVLERHLIRFDGLVERMSILLDLLESIAIDMSMLLDR
jgi:hypothetical protein